MSAHVVLSCERGFVHGTCPEQIGVFGAASVDEARRAAAGVGWHYSGAGDRCPMCVGRPVQGPRVLDAGRG